METYESLNAINNHEFSEFSKPIVLENCLNYEISSSVAKYLEKKTHTTYEMYYTG